MTILDRFNEQVINYPDKIAIEENEQFLSYSFLNDQTNALYKSLMFLDVRPENQVTVLFSRGTSYVIAFLATLRIKAIYSPLSPDISENQQKLLFSTVNKGVVICDEDSEKAAKSLIDSMHCQVSTYIVINKNLEFSYHQSLTQKNKYKIINRSSTHPGIENGTEVSSGCFIVYGSIFSESPIVCKYESLDKHLIFFNKEFNPVVTDRTVQLSSRVLDISLLETLSTLTTGGTLVMLPWKVGETNFEYFSNRLLNKFADVAYLNPYQLKSLSCCVTEKSLFPKKIFLYGDCLNTEVLESLPESIARNTVIINCLHIPEAILVKAFYFIDPKENTFHFGQPVPGSLIVILNGKNLCRIEEEGNVFIKSSNLFEGYLNGLEGNVEHWFQNPFSEKKDFLLKTKLKGKYLKGRNIKIAGRLDNKTYLRGQLIDLELLKERISNTGVSSPFLQIIKNGVNKELLICYHSPPTITSRTLKHLIEMLPGRIAPDYFVPLEKFPVDKHGNINPIFLPSLNQIENQIPFFKRLINETEKEVISAISKIAETDNICINAKLRGFFEYPLYANLLIDYLNRKFGITPNIAKSFKENSIKDLTEYIKREVEINYLKAIEEQEYYNLSNAQRRLWVLDQHDLIDVAYNEGNVSVIEGKFNKDLVEKTLQIVVRKHEILRTIFRLVDGVPKQYVNNDQGPILQYLDWRYLDDREIKARNRVKQDLNTRFNLEEGPLLRALLIRTEDERYIFSIRFHHIILDGWSLVIFFREFVSIYQSLNSDESIVTEFLSLQYKDFTAWQTSFQGSKMYELEKSYWSKQLENFPILNFPTDYVRPKTKTYRGEELQFIVNSNITSRLFRLGQSVNATTFITFLAVIKTLLFRYTGQTDILVGFPIAGRDRNELEMQIGFYVNTLTIRTRFKETDKFIDLLKNVRQQMTDAYAHKSYPFDLLIEELSFSRDLSRSPLFDVFVVNHTTTLDNSKVEINELKISSYGERSPSSKFDLTFDLTELEDQLAVSIIYNKDLFKKDTIIRLSEHFLNLTTSIIDNPHQKICFIDFLSKKERLKLLSQRSYHDSNKGKCKNIHTLFEQQAKLLPDRVALICEDHVITYECLNEKANLLAYHLAITNNVKSGDLVGLYLHKSEILPIAILAILKCGAAYVPLDINAPPARIQFILADCNCSTLIKSKHLSFDARDLNVVIPEDFFSSQPKISPGFLSEDCASNSSMYVIYTSGSTGAPKGVMLEHQGLLDLIHWSWENYDFNLDDVFLQRTPYVFDVSVWEIFVSLCFGAKLIIPKKELLSDLSGFVCDTEKLGITILHFIPSLYNQFLSFIEDDNVLKLKSLQKIFVGGEPILPETVSNHYKKLTIPIYNSYGPTECYVRATTCLMKKDLERVYIGKPLSRIQVYILDPYLNLTPEGVVGEIYLSGSVGRGYLNKPELTNESFPINPFDPGEIFYKTGDLAKWSPDGNIEFIGRDDGQIKMRGFRIEIGEIESLTLTHRGVENAVVIPKSKNGSAIEHLVLFIKLKESVNVSEQSIRELLSEKLPSYAIPTFIKFLDDLPKVASGKIDRKKLNKFKIGKNVGHKEMYVAPINHTERLLKAIWEEVLDISEISTNDNYFEIGGHSLNALKLIDRIRKTFKVDVKLKAFFLNITIQKLAALIKKLKYKKIQAIRPVEEQLHYPVSNPQKRLWLSSQLLDSDESLNINTLVKLTGHIDLQLFEETFKNLLRRHEILITQIKVIKGAPRQVINKKLIDNFKINLLNLSCIKDEVIISKTQAELKVKFNLEKDLMLKVSLLKLSEKEHILCVVIHHIIFDELSSKVIMQDFCGLFNSLKNVKPALDPLKLQYRDYTVWSLQRNDLMEQSKKYWSKILTGKLPKLNLPKNRVRGSANNYSTSEFSLNKNLSTRLIQIGNDLEVSPFIMTLSVLATLLNRYTDDNDLIIGTPVSGRDNQDLFDQIGFYINVLPLRIYCNEEQSFLSQVIQIKNTVLDAFDHQQYQIGQIIEDLDHTLDQHQLPFDVGLTWHTLPEYDDRDIEKLFGFKLERISFEASHQNNLWFHFENQDGHIKCYIEYNANLYSNTIIERINEHFNTLVDVITSDPNIQINKISILSSKEKNVLTNFNVFNDNDNTTLIEMFQRQAKCSPHRIALIFNEQYISYQVLDKRSNQLAYCLINQYDITKNDLVGLMMDRNEWMIISLLGILKAGAAYIPIDPELPKERKLFILEDSNAKLLITTSPFFPEVMDFARTFLVVDLQSEEIDKACEHPLPEIGATDLAYVIYTSGSTGLPKGVLVEHGGCANMSSNQINKFEITSDDHVLQFAPLAFDASVSEVFIALNSGAALVLITKNTISNERQFIDYLRQTNVNVATFPPAYLSTINYFELSFLKKIITAGERAILDQVQALQQNANVYNAYGPTECSVCISIHKIDLQSAVNGDISIGRPLHNLKVRIINRNGSIVPIGFPGELAVSGIGIARGYLNRPELTHDRFVILPDFPNETIYLTGDLGCWSPNGRLKFLGRKDRQVKIRGFRVELDEVEESIKKHTNATECKAISRQVNDDNVLVAYIKSVESWDHQQFRRELGKRLPDYMIPTHFSIIDQFPLNANGKIDVEALPEIKVGAVKRKWVPPTTKTEKKLAQIWQAILGIEKISSTENFFENGGNSLKGIRLITRVFKEFNVKIDIRDVFDYPILSDLAKRIEKTCTSQFVPLPAIEEQDTYPASYAQKAIWIQHNTKYGAKAYNISSIHHVFGMFKDHVLENAFRLLIRHHEILRTKFKLIRGKLRQIILPSTNLNFKIEYEELNEAIEDFDLLVERFLNYSFDLENELLLKCKVIQVKENHHILILLMHHILMDAWSAGIFFDELILSYNALKNSFTPELKKAGVQYKDYTIWENSVLNLNHFKDCDEYWDNKIKTEFVYLKLPTDYERPPTRTYEGNNRDYNLNKDIYLEVVKASAKGNVTVFIFLQACLKVLLYRLTGQTNVIIGIGDANRRHTDVEHLLGCFVNNIPLFTAIEPNQTFQEFLQVVRKTNMEAFAYQPYPLELITKKILRRDPARSTLFDVVMDFQSIEGVKNSLNDLRVEPYKRPAQSSKFDLKFNFYEVSDDLLLNIEYSSVLFKPTTIDLFYEHLLIILKTATKHSNVRINEVEFSTSNKSNNDIDVIPSFNF